MSRENKRLLAEVSRKMADLSLFLTLLDLQRRPVVPLKCRDPRRPACRAVQDVPVPCEPPQLDVAPRVEPPPVGHDPQPPVVVDSSIGGNEPWALAVTEPELNIMDVCCQVQVRLEPDQCSAYRCREPIRANPVGAVRDLLICRLGVGSWHREAQRDRERSRRGMVA